MKGKVFYIILAMCCCLGDASGQDFYSWMKRLSGKANSNTIHIVMELRSFGPENELVYNGKTEIKKQDKNYYYRYDDMEMLINDRVFVLVNHSFKQVSLQFVEASSQLDGIQLNSFDPDSLMRMYKSPSLVKEDQRFVTYRVVQSSGMIDSTEISIDKEKEMLTEIKYKQKIDHEEQYQWVNISFKKFDYAPVFSGDVFDERKFVTVNSGKVILSAKLEGYQLMTR